MTQAICHKKRYASRKLATTSLHWWSTRSKKKRPKRVYLCDVCDAYHLTSNPGFFKYEDTYLSH